VSKLASPKAVWMMIPAAYVDGTIASFTPLRATETFSSMVEIPTTRMTSVAPRNSLPPAINYVELALLAVSGVWNAATAK